MQAYKPSYVIHVILKSKKEKMCFQNLKVFINSKVKILFKNR